MTSITLNNSSNNYVNFINVIQLNTGDGSIVNVQLLDYCVNNKVDILLLQEPYVLRGRLVPLETDPYRVALSLPTVRQKGERNIQVLIRNDLTSENFVVLTINFNGKQVNLISAYFKYRFPTATHLATLSTILRKLKGEIIIGTDVNAASSLWHSDATDGKGELVKIFLIYRDLHCLNLPDNPYTFEGPRGHSNIDVTVASADISDHIQSWKVLRGITNSDHNAIAFKLGLSSHLIYTQRPKRFNLMKAEWAKLSSLLQVPLDIDNNHENAAVSLMDRLQLACSTAIPLGQPKIKPKPPWWTKNVIHARRAQRRASRNRYKSDGSLTEEYKELRNNYTKILRASKIVSWRKFCTLDNKNPWGKVYKWLKKGSKSFSVISALQKEDGTFTETVEETVSYLLNALIPNEKIIRSDAPTLGNFPYAPATDKEIEQAIWKSSPKKAPGEDGIFAIIIRKTWPVIKSTLVHIINDTLRTFPGIFLNVWKTAEVVVFLKSLDRDPSKPNSYRPISLLPVLGKVTERIVVARISTEIQHSSKLMGFCWLQNIIYKVSSPKYLSLSEAD